MKKFNFYIGAAIASWALAAMVIIAQLFAPFKETLAAVFGHHWIGKIILTALVFFAASYMAGKKKTLWNYKAEDAAWRSTIGSLAAILAFFIIEFMVLA